MLWGIFVPSLRFVGQAKTLNSDIGTATGFYVTITARHKPFLLFSSAMFCIIFLQAKWTANAWPVLRIQAPRR